MYFWNIEKLGQKLKSGALSQKEQFQYLLLITIIYILGDLAVLKDSRVLNEHDIFLQILIPIVTVMGVILCARANAKGDAKDFILRVMCLSVPVAIRFAVFLFPLFFFVGFIEALLFDAGPEADTSFLGAIFTAVYIILFFYKLVTSVRQVSTLH